MTAARVEFRKQRADGTWLIGLAMNRTQCRSTSDDFLVDPLLVRPDSAGEPTEPIEGYLVGAYCIERELLTWRRLRFPQRRRGRRRGPVRQHGRLSDAHPRERLAPDPAGAEPRRRSRRGRARPNRGSPMSTVEATRVLLCCEAAEENSWNPVLARHLRAGGFEVTVVHDLDQLRALDLTDFDVCLPRFRACAAQMACLDELLVESGLPMVELTLHEATMRGQGPRPPRLRAPRASPSRRRLSSAPKGSPIARPGGPEKRCSNPCRAAAATGSRSCRASKRRSSAARSAEENLLVQRMIWPARSWRVIVGRSCGVVDPYWRRPARARRSGAQHLHRGQHRPRSTLGVGEPDRGADARGGRRRSARRRSARSRRADLRARDQPQLRRAWRFTAGGRRLPGRDLGGIRPRAERRVRRASDAV